MDVDNRQIRSTNNRGLFGYKAMYKGQKCIAIMKGKECKECLGIIYPEQLQRLVRTGPYIELDLIYNK